MSPKTVKFNLSEKHFEVSRSLIENQFPDTMLGRLISDTWNKNNNKSTGSASESKETEDEAIFIDRDGDLFSYVLHFMRNGGTKICLPITVSKDLLLKDLDFYGIPHNEENITHDEPSYIARQEHMMNILVASSHENAEKSSSWRSTWGNGGAGDRDRSSRGDSGTGGYSGWGGGGGTGGRSSWGGGAGGCSSWGDGDAGGRSSWGDGDAGRRSGWGGEGALDGDSGWGYTSSRA